MRKSGGIISLIAGIFGFIAAIVTLFFGGVGSVFEARGADTVIGLGWGGVFFSFMVIIFGAIQIGTKGKVSSILLTISSIAGIFLGGTLVAVCLSLSLIGGILGLVEGRKESVSLQGEDKTYETVLVKERDNSLSLIKTKKPIIIFVIVVSFLLLLFMIPKNQDVSTDDPHSKQAVTQGLVEYQPSKQKDFIRIIQSSQLELGRATNDMIIGGIRKKRKEEICRLINWGKVENWVGTIETLDSNTEGKGILVIKISDDVAVGTWNNALSDFKAGTLLNPDSNLFSQVSRMNVGDKVIFSGLFVFDDKDCVEVQSITANGSISKPTFTLKFLSVSPLDESIINHKEEAVPHSIISSSVEAEKAQTVSDVNNMKSAQSENTAPPLSSDPEDVGGDGGPDFWAVTGVIQNDTLNIRSMPNSGATKIGEIPYNGVGLRNLGCNDIPLSQWLEMDERERVEARNNRWCKIEYQGISGWVHGKFLKEDTGEVVSGSQNNNIVEIKNVPRKTGFLTKETTARSDIKSKGSMSVGIKNGTEIVITGISNDNEWYEIEAKPLQGKFYVPVGNVGTFGN